MRTKFNDIVTVCLPIALVGCMPGRENRFMVRVDDGGSIEAATASICNSNIPLKIRSHEVTGVFHNRCAGPLLIQMTFPNSAVLCKLGYIGSAEISKRFDFRVRNGQCVFLGEVITRESRELR
jgi:hypothetical protein